MYTYLFWLSLAVGYSLLQVWVATTMGWVGTPERELLSSALTRLPLLGLLFFTYRREERSTAEEKSVTQWLGWAVSAALGVLLLLLIFSKGSTYGDSGKDTLFYFVSAMLVIAATEEYLFRGHLLLARLRKGGSSWQPWLIATLAFAGIHAVNGLIYAGSSWSGIISQMVYALLIGGLLGWLAILIRRIWPLILLHAGLNIGLATARLQDTVFDPDSQLSPVAVTVMVLALAMAAWTAWQGRRSVPTIRSGELETNHR